MSTYHYWWPLDSASNPPGLHQACDNEGAGLLNIGSGEKVVFPGLEGSPEVTPDDKGNCALSAELMTALKNRAVGDSNHRIAFDVVSDSDPKPQAFNYAVTNELEDSFATVE